MNNFYVFKNVILISAGNNLYFYVKGCVHAYDFRTEESVSSPYGQGKIRIDRTWTNKIAASDIEGEMVSKERFNELVKYHLKEQLLELEKEELGL